MINGLYIAFFFPVHDRELAHLFVFFFQIKIKGKGNISMQKLI